MLSDFVKYVKQYWHDRPDKSTPLNADRLNHIENGIASNSEAINQIANAVVSNIVNDPEKIASMAAVYALQEKLGTGELPSDAPNAISAINTLYSNLKTPVIGNPTFDSSYFTNKGTQIKKIGTTVTVKIVGTIKFDAMTSFATNKIMDIPEGFRPIWSIGEYHILGKNVTDLIMIESTSIGINKQFSSGNQNVEFSIIYLTSE